ncbi:TonB-dependent receptor plug domain-containing protein [Shewanella intestini]|uniref:TonB-dependent receptor plug domain-containing protein n=1 Tax=Shewanella intestini TaxID=2017544 RepID=A0ABS5I025_9GAMM|nr:MULTISPECIES: TonB-dependent receptor plug domain-containing protein [Shewanella]MBR9727389.1 TonB-dependent receptor plug domain-containing protein [Shewanella intestini]
MEQISHLKVLSVSILLALYGQSAYAEQALPSLPETQAMQAEVQAHSTIDREQINNTPMTNTDLSSLLKNQSGVGIDSGVSSLRGGDLTPEQISIAGARPHQTQYMIGGVSTNNIATASDNADAQTLGTGHTSGYFVDTALMEQVEVLDRNVGPQYGGFTGGVVNVELRKPQDTFQAEYQYRMTDSDWNAEPVTSSKNNDFGDASFGDGRYQPDYQKRFHSLHLSGALTDTQKLAVNYSKKDSEIPLNNNGEKADYGQSIDNLFVTHQLDLGLWQLQSDLRYSNFTNKEFLNIVGTDADGDARPYSDSTNKHQGIGATVKLTGEFDSGTWDTSLTYDQLEDERLSEVDYYSVRTTIVTGSPISQENTGGYGNLRQQQDTWQLKSVYNLAPVYLGEQRHKFMLGTEIVSQQAEQSRQSDFNALNFLNLNGKESISTWNYYHQGSVAVDSQRYALFANDEISWDQLTVNVGARAEHMSQFDKLVIAPRLSASWDFNSDNVNRITFGLNRYYSNDQLGWELREAAKGLKTVFSSCTANNGDYTSTDINDYTCANQTDGIAASLDTAEVPYSDELSLGWQYETAGISFNPSYLLREQKDGLALSSNGQLNNNIQSKSHILGLNIHNIQRWSLMGGALTSYLDVTYEDRTGSGNLSTLYDNSNDLNSSYDDDWVYFDGKLIRSSDMDSSGFNSPLEGRLGAVMTWENIGLSWSNVLNYQDGRNLTHFAGTHSAEIDGETTNVKAINTAKMDSLTTWDSSIRWTPQTLVKHHASVELSVTNLLNRHVEVATYGTDVGGGSAFTDTFFNKGREFWLSFTLRN